MDASEAFEYGNDDKTIATSDVGDSAAAELRVNGAKTCRSNIR